MVDGYALNGTPQPDSSCRRRLGAPSSARPASARWPPPPYFKLRDDAYASVASLTLLAGSTYYDESWTVLSLLMMGGRMEDLTATN